MNAIVSPVRLMQARVETDPDNRIVTDDPSVVEVSLSIVSHGHGSLVSRLLDDLRECIGTRVELILTRNIPEPLPASFADLPFPTRLIDNSARRGFGANHNAAFNIARGEYFCVLNPDIRIAADPFVVLIDELDDPRVGVVAPRVINLAGKIEDSARRFPTLLSLLWKLFRNPVDVEYSSGETTLSPDWVAGMFMLFRRDV
ncbi:MAG: glycosyltransferase, partial [Betaproteobacteria bacterium]